MEVENCNLEEEIATLKASMRGDIFSGGIKFEVSPHWYTPQVYVDAAREVMGDIDIDPATDERAQKRIKAKVYHTDTPEKDAFKFHWYGRMLLCPPYAEGLIDRFFYKVIEEHKFGNLIEGVIITHTIDTGNDYFIDILNFADSICFIRGPIEWVKGHLAEEIVMEEMGIPWKPKDYSKHYNCAIYFGPNRVKFMNVFSQFGVCYYGK
jgi:ParB family chromosome partitioning protein